MRDQILNRKEVKTNMRDWVKPFLLQRKPLNPERLENENVVYYELADCLKYDFGAGHEWPINTLIETFGSVLAELPEEVFNKIYRIENLFFIFSPLPGPEIKIFHLKNDLRAGPLRIVNFPFDSALMPVKALKGEMAHELAHIYKEHEITSEEIEDEANGIAKSWGLEEEIKAFKEYKKKMIKRR
jgi:hypothetical protein